MTDFAPGKPDSVSIPAAAETPKSGAHQERRAILRTAVLILAAVLLGAFIIIRVASGAEDCADPHDPTTCPVAASQ